ncbi:hypothetical protein ES708_04297 [subsurface metagenome]
MSARDTFFFTISSANLILGTEGFFGSTFNISLASSIVAGTISFSFNPGIVGSTGGLGSTANATASGSAGIIPCNSAIFLNDSFISPLFCITLSTTSIVFVAIFALPTTLPPNPPNTTAMAKPP